MVLMLMHYSLWMKHRLSVQWGEKIFDFPCLCLQVQILLNAYTVACLNIVYCRSHPYHITKYYVYLHIVHILIISGVKMQNNCRIDQIFCLGQWWKEMWFLQPTVKEILIKFTFDFGFKLELELQREALMWFVFYFENPKCDYPPKEVIVCFHFSIPCPSKAPCCLSMWGIDCLENTWGSYRVCDHSVTPESNHLFKLLDCSFII